MAEKIHTKKTFVEAIAKLFNKALKGFKGPRVGTVTFRWNDDDVGVGVFASSHKNVVTDLISRTKTKELKCKGYSNYVADDQKKVLAEVEKIFEKVRATKTWTRLTPVTEFRLMVNIGSGMWGGPSITRKVRLPKEPAPKKKKATAKKKAAKGQSIKDSWARIDAWIKAQGGFKGLKRAATARNFKAAEDLLSPKLSKSLKEFWGVHNGGLRMGPWEFMGATESRNEMRVSCDADDDFPYTLSPICRDDAGNLICVDRKKDTVHQVTWDPYGQGLLSRSFAKWFAEQADEIEAGRYGLDRTLGLVE